MIGRFDICGGAPRIHHIPQNESADGKPVIVLPLNDVEIVAGGTYEFNCRRTHKATLVLNGVVYRVAHAIKPILVELADCNTLRGTVSMRSGGGMSRYEKAVDETKLGLRLNSSSLVALTDLRDKLKK